MTHRLGHVAGSLVCALFLIVACGGSSFEESDDTPGGDSGASNTAGASGEANAGSANGGSASGGGASAGSSSSGTTSDGGVTSGGSSNGGVTSGGSSNGGVTSGGSSNGGGISSGGGASTACNEDGDCVACAYPTAPTKAADCYCASCAGTPLSKTACATNKAAWEANCTTNPTPCPAIACILPPVPACRSHMCVAK